MSNFKQKNARELEGTSEQQLWQIAKFHETRLNQLFSHITKNENEKSFQNDNSSLFETLGKRLESLEKKVVSLEKENATLKAKAVNSVSLNMSE
jgi:hypothetical protein